MGAGATALGAGATALGREYPPIPEDPGVGALDAPPIEPKPAMNAPYHARKELGPGILSGRGVNPRGDRAGFNTFGGNIAPALE